MPDAWPFDQPPNCAVIVTKTVLDRTEWIGLVTHDADDHGWQFLPLGGVSDPSSCDEGRTMALHEVCKMDPSVIELANMPPGWIAWRESLDTPWQREPQNSVGD